MLKITSLSFLLTLSLTFTCLAGAYADSTVITNETFYNPPFSDQFDFKISPNPAKDIIKVKFTSNVSSNLSIHDSLGNEVLLERVNNELSKEISLQNLKSGIYFVSIKIEDKTIIKRLVKIS